LLLFSDNLGLEEESCMSEYGVSRYFPETMVLYVVKEGKVQGTVWRRISGLVTKSE
jgi:hypothetical protein